MRRANREKGQALVESALVLLVFLTVLIGIFDLVQVLFMHQTLTERARNAVRYGAVRAYDETAVQNMVLFNHPEAPQDATIGVFGLTRAMVQVTRRSPGTPADRLSVTISDYPYRLFNPVIAGLVRGKDIVATIPYEVP